jgi:predicted ABC-type exoprotein transport system permease subunit
MKKKIKFLLRLLAIIICTFGLCSMTEPGSLLFVVILLIAIFAACAANAAYQDEKMEDLINKQ